MKNITIIISFLLLYTSVFSQELPKIIPPSPNAASLGKYGQVPVGLFTGTPQVNIPLYEIKIEDFSIPLSLNYSSNGIRVDEISSNVGLGWSLNAGGVITRSLRDEADEGNRVHLPDLSITSEEMKTFLSGVINSVGMDTQPDLFSFNFNGNSGKFYLNDSLKSVLIEPKPLKIEKNSSGFKIIDSFGNIYWFGDVSANEVSHTRNYGTGNPGGNISNDVENAWYLTKIKTIKGSEINFLYDSVNLIHDVAISQNVSGSKIKNTNENGGVPYYQLANHNQPSITMLYSSTPVLKEINWKENKVLFSYSSKFSSISTTDVKLDSITIYDKTNFLIKKIDLSYLEYNTLSAFENPDNLGIDNTNNKRLFLEKVTMFPNEVNDKFSYAFDYYSPNEMPPRLSYAQDYWGYFNGSNNPDLVPNDISLYNPRSYDDPDFYLPEIQSIFQNVGGDRNPNSVYGVKGLLKKIIYPTGGYNEFIYEPHSYNGTKLVFPNKTESYINIHTNENDMGVKDTITTNPILFNQPGTPLYFTTGAAPCWQPSWPSHHITANLTVKVADQGSENFVIDSSNQFYAISYYGGAPVYLGNSITVDVDSESTYYIDLREGKKYQFIGAVYFECVRGDFGIDYYDKPPEEVQTNIEIGGQRLKEIISENGRGKKEIKKYYYGDMSCFTCSSGEVQPIRPAISFSTTESVSVNQDTGITDNVTNTVTLGSNSLEPLYDSQGYHISYKSVIEEYGNNGEGGVTLHEYNVVNDNIPMQSGDLIPGTGYTNGFGNGSELKSIFYSKAINGSYIKNREQIYRYKETNNILDNSIEGFTTSIRLTLSGSGGTSYSYNLNKYNLNSHWRYLDQTIQNQYDKNGLNPITTTTNYYYDNLEHLQVTRKEVLNSSSELIKTRTYYPNDKDSLSGLSTIALQAIDSLISKHQILVPIQVDTKITDTLNNVLSDSYVRTNYKDWGTSLNGVGNIILPETIQTSKKGSALEERVIYYKYDDKGNPLELSKKDGTHIVYIWGYNGEYPIAKIENATYVEVQSAIGAPPYNTSIENIQTLSNQDIDAISEESLRTALNVIRNSLPNSQVTTYTYDPLIGVTSITDPRGETVYYEYDSFNRLKFVKDKEGNILSENKYHYKNQ